jgi:osmotically-inducible protein OsmY
MNQISKTLVVGLGLIALLSSMQGQTQSSAPADRELSQKISRALADAGVDSRTTSVRVITTSDHVVYLTGLISNKDTLKLAGDVAAKTAPSFRVVNQIHSSFFDDPNHVTGDKTK